MEGSFASDENRTGDENILGVDSISPCLRGHAKSGVADNHFDRNIYRKKTSAYGPSLYISSSDNLRSRAPSCPTSGQISLASSIGRNEIAALRNNHRKKVGNRSANDLCEAAVAAHVSQRDIVRVFAETIESVARLNESRAEGVFHAKYSLFFENERPKVLLRWYLWRLICFLNKFPIIEPTFFAEDEAVLPEDFESGRVVNRLEDSSAISRGLRAMLLALVYIDRLTTIHPDFVISMLSVHRVVLTALMIATKFSDDFPVGAKIFAKLGSLSVPKMQELELEFCQLIGFNLHITADEFTEKCLRTLTDAFDIASERRRRKNRSRDVPIFPVEQ